MMEKKQFIFPEILVHDMRRNTIIYTSPGDVNNTPGDDGECAPSRGGFGSPTMEDNSNWNDLSGFESNGSGW